MSRLNSEKPFLLVTPSDLYFLFFSSVSSVVSQEVEHQKSKVKVKIIVV